LEPPNPLRKTAYQNDFYDLQARAMFHGHLSLANGSLGIEGFVHDGRTYTYFGLFPSIIRMPFLLVTSGLDGRLTAPFMLIAWLLTGWPWTEELEEGVLGMDSELSKDGGQMIAYGTLTNEECFGDRGHSFSLSKQVQNLPLTARQVAESRVIIHTVSSFKPVKHTSRTNF
jgi:hypothetical protein